MAEEKPGFIRRWSERKTKARAESEHDPATAARPEQAPSQAPAPLPELPSIDSLTRESDFTVFLGAGVPEDLRVQALRKLWRSDPVLANLDGLNDYDQDLSRHGAGAIVRTAYRIGKGMIDRAEAPSEPPVTEAEDIPDSPELKPDQGSEKT